jgi:lysozyme
VPDANKTAIPPDVRPKPKDVWDKADILGRLLGSILIPVGLAVAGFYVNSALQDRQAKEKTAEIAVTILQSKDNSMPELRTWALGVFNQTLVAADQPLSTKALDELDNAPLPSAGMGATAVKNVARFEGFRSGPYLDSAGVWTIGFGHQEGVTADTAPITLEQAKELLLADTTKVNLMVADLVTVRLSSNQRAALIDLASLIGRDKFQKSKLLNSINTQHFDRIPSGFMDWNKVEVDGKLTEVPARTRRLESDIKLWNTPDESAGDAPH